MNWRQAYDTIKTALEAEATIVANSIPVLDGAHAAMAISSLAELLEGTFADNPFSVVIEHPTASVFEQTRGQAFLKNAFNVIIVENPTQRETTALDPLAVPYAIATGVLGQPGGAGGQSLTANQEFYRYQGDARGFLFHRFTFLLTTTLPAAGLPSGPSPVAL
jgi:hypothetical protein